MKKTITTITLGFLFSAQILVAQILPNEMVQRMGRGINIGNSLDAPNEGDWSLPLEQVHFEDIKEAGFTNVRIPIRWDEHTDKSSPYTIEPEFIDRVEEIVDWALNIGLVAIINAHHEDWFTEDSQSSANQERLKSIWRQVSFRFKDKSENLIFEPINEPYFDMSKAEMDDFNAYILPIVREYNPTRIIMITGGGDNSYKTPKQIDLDFFKNDAYLMTTFHYYRPFKFTNYGVGNNQNYTWGTNSEKNEVKNNFNEVHTWAQENNIAIYFGEFTTNNTCDEESRIEYHRYLTELAIDRGFAFGVWCTGKSTANKYTYDKGSRTWVEPVKEVLLSAGAWPSVGINNQDKRNEILDNKIEVYPNPVNDYLNYTNASIESIEIANSIGAIVLKTNAIQGQVNVSLLNTGVYFVKCFTNDGLCEVHKMLKQ